MNIAVPIFSNERVYDQVEITKPKTGVIATTHEAAQRNVFRGILEFVAGSIESITSVDGDVIENKTQIKKLCGLMPYVSADALALQIMATINKDDIIDGIYKCPRCGSQVVPEYDPSIGLDTRDRISDLAVTCMDEYHNEITVTLPEPVKLKNKKTDEVLHVIESFAIRFPTLNDCIVASQGIMEGQDARMQIKIYITALIMVNGESVEKKWTATWGKLLFDNLSVADMSQIGDVLQSYGLDKYVDRVCPKCGKEWRAPVNTSNFFASGLQSV